jgi:hypothetical protein
VIPYHELKDTIAATIAHADKIIADELFSSENNIEKVSLKLGISKQYVCNVRGNCKKGKYPQGSIGTYKNSVIIIALTVLEHAGLIHKPEREENER